MSHRAERAFRAERERAIRACIYCREIDVAHPVGVCLAVHKGFRCTRQLHHLGDHASCGHLVHPLAVWKNASESESDGENENTSGNEKKI